MVSALDTLLYLERYHGEGCRGSFVPRKAPPSLEEYLEWMERLSRRYLPVIPRLGLNGLMLSLGVNRCFRRERIPLRARWCMGKRKFWGRMAEQLGRDIPVIFSAGPAFPGFWRKRKLTLYARDADGNFRGTASAYAHFMTATGLEADWIRVSSWGREYWVNRGEFEAYVREGSCYPVSNLLYLKQTRRRF